MWSLGQSKEICQKEKVFIHGAQKMECMGSIMWLTEFIKEGELCADIPEQTVKARGNMEQEEMSTDLGGKL